MRANRERKFVLLFCGAVLLVIVAVSFLAPPSDDSDKSPTSYNSGRAGIKAAYLLLGELGYPTARWEKPSSELANLDAPHTTVIFAEPIVPPEKQQAVRNDIAAFLQRGGRVLITGPQADGLLPEAEVAEPTQLFGKLCLTTPEGRGVLAHAGQVSITDQARWTALVPAVHVEQWCGADAVVVSYHVGAGTAVWWSSALPLTNVGLKDDASLKLFLASVDGPDGQNSDAGSSGRPRQRILFDEYFHGIQTSLADYTRGLPLIQIAVQIALVALLLILSFGRRNGPIRLIARLPRTSPIEFAESMGHLYRKGGATQAATESARRQLLRFLSERCGIPRSILQADAAAIAAALSSRFAGDWSELAIHLTQAAEAQYQSIAPRSALTLVKALDHDLKILNKRTKQPQHP
jgi:hypothetical protein